MVTAGKHFSPKVPVSSCTGTGLQCLEKEGAGGAAVRLAGTPQSSAHGRGQKGSECVEMVPPCCSGLVLPVFYRPP